MNTFDTVEDETGPQIDESEESRGEAVGEQSEGAPGPSVEEGLPAKELANNSPSDIEVISEAWI